MTDIPQIVEDLYYETVMIPDQKDWPDYLGKDPLVVHSLYAFYYGLRAGFQLSGALREKEFIPSAE